MRTDAVADGQNRVEVVVVNRAGNLAISLGLNYSEFPNSSRRVEFTILENALQVLIDGRHRDLEQSRDQPLWKPDRFMRQSHFDPRLAVFSLVKDELAGIVRRRCGEVLCHGDSFPVKPRLARFFKIAFSSFADSANWPFSFAVSCSMRSSNGISSSSVVSSAPTYRPGVST